MGVQSLVQYGLGDWPAALRDAEAVLECAGPEHACFHKAVYRSITLERDLVGEEEEGEEVDTGAALDEMIKGLEAHPGFLLLEERRCSRVLLALLPAYPDKVASVLRAAHAARDDGPGSRVLWQDPWLAGQLLAVPLLSTACALPQTLLQSLQRIGAGAKGAAVDADWVRAASGALAAFARSAPQLFAPGSTDGRPAAGTPEPLRVAAGTFLALADADLTSSSDAQTIDAASAAQLPEAERRALEELQKKRAAVYNPDLVSCRHALLDLVAQLVVADGFSASAACIADLLRVARTLHEASPQRMVRAGAAGEMRYEKRRFTADFADNPAGDFLLRLDLPGSLRAAPGIAGKETLLLRVLALVQEAARRRAPFAKRLARQDGTGELLRELLVYADAETRGTARDLAAALCAAGEADIGLSSPTSLVLVCSALAVPVPGDQTRACAHMVELLPAASDEEFQDTVSAPCLWAALRALCNDCQAGPLPDGRWKELIRALLKRSSSKSSWPHGLAWDNVEDALRTWLLEQAKPAPAQQAFPSLPRGFLAGDSAPLDATEADVADLQDVFDSSTAIPPATRKARAAWLALPQEARVRWSQASSDVSCFLAVPRGTRAAEISVQSDGSKLAVRLGWYGSLLDAELWADIKAAELHWCLEDEELHVLMPKRAGGWWKALTKGGTERSYHELLHEAVNADEPVTAYDELSEEAKDLIDSIRERQAYIAAGMLDPEGFDDFRVVIGENSLQG
ncbi:hypothetical protein QBZ16_000700 [Prototheca wickerhamii]|uniref:CS domain-containing protein n=1 Tax=Prototheca wickerhamii TaxID=3111 RepID=A0AAD9IN98_PROWI|nr:hypothetical protein QBZ16_000700 [Prototheca wickerhamii]